jgi:hypothetical protein
MRRKLFTLPAAGLAVPFVAACVLWVRTAGRIAAPTAGTHPPARFARGQSPGEAAAGLAASGPVAPSSTRASGPPRAWPMGPADAEIAAMRAASKRRAARAAHLVAQGVAAFQKCTARIDPAPLPAVRERWLQEWR